MFRPVFAKRSRKTSICCFVGALGCSRVPPDTFFVDFGADLGWIFDIFGTISGGIFYIETRNVLAGVGTALLFGAEFSHSLGKKCALTRTTHPQLPLSKGGGLAKRPQLSSAL